MTPALRNALTAGAAVGSPRVAVATGSASAIGRDWHRPLGGTIEIQKEIIVRSLGL
jgi:hypothetical protein